MPAINICVPFEEELKRNRELKKDDIKYLQGWCKKQPHLPKISNSELALFLHSNYYRLEPTKSTIDAYYTMRTHMPEFFAGRDPIESKELRRTFNVISCLPLETTTDEGYKILYFRLLDAEPAKYVYNDHVKFLNISIDLWMLGQGTIDGHVILCNAERVSLGHIARISPVGLKKFFLYIQEGLPVRLKGIHFMNTCQAVDAVLNIIRPFLKKDLMNLIHTHTSKESLSEFVPVAALPNECGGSGGPLLELHSAQVKKLEDHREWFLQELVGARIDESKRPGKAKSDSDIFGIEGSFKKLDID